jgi:deoxyribodipyrimidine photo-lyase
VTDVVLFTRDLRVHDHPALSAATRAGGRVIPLFVFDPRLLGRSPNRDRFLTDSLADLERSLVRLRGGLVTRGGDPVAHVVDLVRRADVRAVHLSEDVSAFALLRERRLRAALEPLGVALHVHPGNAVVAPGDVAPGGKPAYSVFTPYHRAWAAAPRRPLDPVPARIELPPGLEPGPRPHPSALHAESIDLAPGGETAGRRHLDAYLTTDAARYADVRDDLAADRTSRLSAYLRFGCLSANEVVARAAAIPGADGLIRQVAWRDFYGQLLAHDPTLQWRSLREPPADIPPPPQHAGYFFECWQEGRTGIPLVDAGMRQLRREGWMHNRARMVVASYLTRRLGIPWQEGAVHFMRWLVDGDPANNAGGWQWAAGTGTDPRRSRSFNPVRQAERFDPEGSYVRRYVRELAGTPAALIFAPWKEPDVLRATGYPAPILEVPAARPAPVQTSFV